MKKAKIIGIDSEKIVVLYQDSTNEHIPRRFFPEELQQMDLFIEIDETKTEKGIEISITEGNEFELLCTCPQECDCENPPPKDWDGKSGVYQISELCPIHNQHRHPDENCPVHG